ncbi:MAG: T9SS type A sorting domain-containing protein [Flavobacterium sp.]|nr:T9SS type A sorting domain-containing protein [Flavobacterium sp.]
MKLLLQILVLSLAINANAQSPTFEWARTMGGNQSIARSTAVDNAGNVYTAGTFRDTGDFDSSANTFNLTANGVNDFYITKYSAAGNFIWAKNFGAVQSANTANNDDQHIQIVLDSQGNIVCTGTFLGIGDFDPSAATATLSSATFQSGYVPGNFILKLNGDGNFIWVKKITAYLHCTGDSIFVDNTDEIYLIGNYLYTADLDPGPGVFNVSDSTNMNIYIVKLTANGDFIWGQSLNNNNGEQNQKKITVDANKNVYLCGTFRNTLDLDPGAAVFNVTSNGEKDVFFIKLNNLGNFQWGKSIGGQDNENANDISVDFAGNFYAVGVFAFIVDFDPGAAVFPINASTILTNYLLKLDTNGNFNWALKLGDSVKIPNVANDAQGNVYVSSGFSSLLGPIDADPGPNVYNLTTSPDNDMYFFKLDTNSNFIWAFNYGDGKFRESYDLLIDSNNNMYYCGRFSQGGSQDLVDLNPFAGVNAFSALTSSYMVKLAQPGTLNMEDFNELNKIVTFPNPTSSQINFSFNDNLENASLKITSLLGQTVLEKQNLSGNNLSFDVSDLATGMYVVTINNGGLVSNSKFIKE